MIITQAMTTLLRSVCSVGLLLWVIFVYGSWLNLLPDKWSALGPVLSPVVLFGIPIALVFLIGLTNRGSVRAPARRAVSSSPSITTEPQDQILDATQPPQLSPRLRPWLRSIGAGLGAILTWVVAVAFVQWYQTPSGYLGYWAVALSVVLVLEILTVMSPSVAMKLLDPFAALLSSIFENYEANMDWVG
jgi:hypothetical protein